jgi:ParB family transcriptional regulator, chromosome partitioning protein
MSSRGNKGFADLIAGEAGRTEARLPPKTGILAARENRLSAMATGSVVSRVHELVDPTRCRIWEGHNRDYATLNEVNCADLIDSLKAQQRQEVPAIVRRVMNDPDCDYEVICGARRHWSVSWLRAHDYPQFRFLIEPRELSDEEAFRIADLENRNRKDLSDHERAMDYHRAVERYYGGSQQRMAERLQVTKSWLSRYLELARLPPEVIAAFGSPHELGISHAARLAPALKQPRQRDGIIELATEMAAEQAERRKAGIAFHTPALVLQRLLAPKPRSARNIGQVVIRGANDVILARGERMRTGSISITIPSPAQHDRKALVGAFEQVMAQLVSEKASPSRR